MYDLYGTDHRPVLASFEISNDENNTTVLQDKVVLGKNERGCALI
jgi:hypothetical protein